MPRKENAMPHVMPHRISAGVIVEHESRVLLVNHVRPGRYDFWVCPGGGVKGEESLEEAAAREAFEETGLNVRVAQLLYIEELVSPECRYVKFWFSGECTGGTFDVSHPEAQAEHVLRADWLLLELLHRENVFPTVLAGRYWKDKVANQGWPVRLPLRNMTNW
jgi:ADP-ribose pyrophosphatase YjhB (NUDIX family)